VRVRLAPLPVPAENHPADTLQDVPSVALFTDRAARARLGFAPAPGELRLVADIVRRLDGVPLAIELAASRLSGLGLADLHQRLDRALGLLAGGRPSPEARHRTLTATLEWSYRLLDDDQRRLFRHLAIFPDGADLATAEFVAGDLPCRDDPGLVLTHLVDASMLDATLDGGTRYRMLQTVRAFGISQLDAAGELDAATGRLVRWAVRLAGWIGSHGAGAGEPAADAALRREIANLRSAWHACRRRGDLDAAAAIVVHLSDMADWRELTELRTWTEDLATDPALAGHPHQGAVLGCAAAVAYHRGDDAVAAGRARAGLQVAQDAEASRLCLGGLSLAGFARQDWAQAVGNALAAAAVAEHPTESPGIAALAAAYSGDLHRARNLNERLRGQARNHTLRGLSAYTAAEIDAIDGQAGRALQEYDEAITLAREAGASFLEAVATLGRLALLARSGHPGQALAGFRDVIGYFVQLGNWTHLWTALRNLADLFRRLGDDQAATLITACCDRVPDPPSRTRALDEASRAIDRHLPAFRRPAQPGGSGRGAASGRPG
jgi:tetratricopeptide (TPR) repeat protein